MNDPQPIETLKAYALANTSKLVEQDSSLSVIYEMLLQGFGSTDKTAEAIDDYQAEALTKWHGEHIGTPFSDSMVKSCHEIGVKVLEIASDVNSNNEHMCLVAKYLHPLFSQDERTIDIGWDLEEYMDWYFNGTSAEERQKYATELMSDWAVASEIAE